MARRFELLPQIRPLVKLAAERGFHHRHLHLLPVFALRRDVCSADVPDLVRVHGAGDFRDDVRCNADKLEGLVQVLRREVRDAAKEDGVEGGARERGVRDSAGAEVDRRFWVTSD